MKNDFNCSTCGKMSDDENLLHENKWEHWYAGKGWWVRPDTVSDPTRQDFTNYQFTTAQALEFQKHPNPAVYVGDIGAALAIGVKIARRHA